MENTHSLHHLEPASREHALEAVCKISNCVTALIVRMPLTGITPLKLLVKILKMLTARITWSPLSGSAPSK
eukprot:1093642-Amphidinium_carterae.1